MDDTEQIFLHQIAVPGIVVGSIDAAEAAAIRQEYELLMDRPVINRLIDIPDVDGEPANNAMLIWDATARSGAGAWILTDPVPPIAVSDTTSVDLTLDGTTIRADVVFAGTGTDNRAARWDHTHTAPGAFRDEFSASGYVSSGSRPAGSLAVPLDAGKRYLVKAILSAQIRGADPGQCHYQMSLSVNGNIRTSPSGAYWAVQGVPNKERWTHYLYVNGTGSAIPVAGSIIYGGQGGLNLDNGELVVEVFPTR